MPPRQRRTYLVDRSFQLKYTVVLGAWGLLLASIFGVSIWHAHEHAVEIALRGGGAHRGDRLLLWALAGMAPLSAAALGLVGFFVSHRIAGPVYVMGRDLRLLAQGRFPEQRPLRRGDELKSLFALFGHAVDALREREERRTRMLEELLERMEAASPRAPELTPVIQVVAAEVHARRSALEEARGRVVAR